MFAVLRPRHTLLVASCRSSVILGRRWRTVAIHTPQQIAAGEYVRNEATLPIKELVTLRDVIYLLNKTNKHLMKKSILQQYAVPLKDVLLFIYDPHIRMYITSAGLKRYVERKPADEEKIAEVEHNSIMTLFTELQKREVTGNAAMERVGTFLHYIKQLEHKVKDDAVVQKQPLEEIFYRCLDRNLRAGTNQQTIHEVFGGSRAPAKIPLLLKKWPAEVRHGAHTLLTSIRGAVDFGPKTAGELEIEDTDTFHEVMKERDNEERRNNPQPAKKKTASNVPSSAPYGVALGKSTSLESLRGLFEKAWPGADPSAANPEEGPTSWYISRKLDGVRCIVRMDVDVSAGIKSPLHFVDVETLSRSERSFTSLDVLKEDLKALLCDCPSIVTLVEKEYKRKIASSASPLQTISIYFDGELCALRPQINDAVNSNDFTEDFSEIVGIVRRKSYTVPNPAYFPFDVLTETEFREWRSHGENSEDHEPFYVRRRRVQDVVKHCQDKGSVIVRELEQKHVTTYDQVVALAERAAEKKWEGLILRKGNLYEGKRSPSIRKYKHWMDAEYTVLDVQKAVMRLPVDQVYEDREVMSSVTIKHNDTEVLVGSGFTVEERILYGDDPSLITGKEITVQYFSESHSSARAKEGDLSLRFPRVKKVWEDGSRDV